MKSEAVLKPSPLNGCFVSASGRCRQVRGKEDDGQRRQTQTSKDKESYWQEIKTSRSILSHPITCFVIQKASLGHSRRTRLCMSCLLLTPTGSVNVYAEGYADQPPFLMFPLWLSRLWIPPAQAPQFWSLCKNPCSSPHSPGV